MKTERSRSNLISLACFYRVYNYEGKSRRTKTACSAVENPCRFFHYIFQILLISITGVFNFDRRRRKLVLFLLETFVTAAYFLFASQVSSVSAIAGLTLMPSKVVTVETGKHSMAFSGRFKRVRAKMFSRTYLIFLQTCHALS